MNAYAKALQDLKDGLGYYRFWTALALLDWGQRYHRSSVGILWILLSFAIFVAVKSIIFGALATVAIDYFSVYVVLGFLAWQFMSGVINEGCTVFISSGSWIKGLNLPLSTFVYHCVVRNLIAFGIAGIVAIAAILYFGTPIRPIALLVFPAILAFVINALWVQLLFGVISARFRDFGYFVSTMLRLFIFLTPIMWIPSQLGAIEPYIYWNPLTHFVEIFRAPVLDGRGAGGSWLAVIAITIVGWALALAVFARYRTRIVFWL